MAKKAYRIVGHDGIACPRCGEPTQIREHDAHPGKHTRRPFHYSRWFNCVNSDCQTTLIMRDEFKVMNEHSRDLHLTDFVRESNRIEGIARDPTAAELDATAAFIGLTEIAVKDVADLVETYQPGAVLRVRPGLNVRVGSYIAPAGGPLIGEHLEHILRCAVHERACPWRIHLDYERLHPFTDGNGRSGRAIWAWMMHRRGGFPLGFLHHFYYQTLENAR